MKSTDLKILVIEDNPDICRNIADYFEQQGATLDFAPNGELGLILGLEHYYDCIVLDIMLSKLDGLTVCQQLRLQSARYIPIIMMTARDSLADKRIGFGLGADDYLPNPIA